MSLPNWTAGMRVARAVAGIKTGRTTVEDAVFAVEDASNRRDWAGREDALDAWVADGCPFADTEHCTCDEDAS